MKQDLTDTEIKRLKAISDITDFLEEIRKSYGTHKHECTKIINQIGELDGLEELHRLLYNP